MVWLSVIATLACPCGGASCSIRCVFVDAISGNTSNLDKRAATSSRSESRIAPASRLLICTRWFITPEQHELRITIFGTRTHSPDIGPMPVNNEHRHDGQVDEKGLVIGQASESQPDRQCRCRRHRGQADISGAHEHDAPRQQYNNNQLRSEKDQCPDQRGSAFAALEAVINRPDMAEDRGCGTRQC